MIIRDRYFQILITDCVFRITCERLRYHVMTNICIRLFIISFLNVGVSFKYVQVQAINCSIWKSILLKLLEKEPNIHVFKMRYIAEAINTKTLWSHLQ